MKKTFVLSLFIFFVLCCSAQTNKYKIVVKFGSMCCGVPSNKPLLDYITVFKKKNKIKKIACDKIGPMGKEGEYHMGFTLRELKKKQVAIFVKGVTVLASTMKEQGYANVVENIELDLTSLGRATIQKKNL